MSPWACFFNITIKKLVVINQFPLNSAMQH